LVESWKWPWTNPTGLAQLGLTQLLIESLTSSIVSLPSDHNLLLPLTDGISLLDTKTSLLLSYMQNLVFLIILTLRQTADPDKDVNSDIDAATVKELVSAV
jgi:U3 small nucleolar ribonucleoprotein protein LCP5